MSKGEFVKSIFSKEVNENIKGFLSSDIIKKLKKDSTAITGYVLQGMEYRPDKISAYYLGTTDYDWVILAVNTVNGLQDLTFGKELVIPSIQAIESIRI